LFNIYGIFLKQLQTGGVSDQKPSNPQTLIQEPKLR
jgi:hypothetical protein